MSDAAQPLSKKAKAAAAKDAAAAAASTAATPAVAAPATPAASADALMDLLASRIDHLETAAAPTQDDSVPMAAEQTAISERCAAAQETVDALAGQSTQEQVAALLKLFREEVQQRVVLQRQLADSREKLTRSSNQKRSLENLCKQLEERNKKLGSELKTLSQEHSRNHLDMKKQFEANLADIQTQLNRHSEDRLAQQKENEKLRENLASLLKFDSMREEHHQQQLKTKELEAKLAEAKLAQQSDFAVAEAKKARDQQQKIDLLQSLEANLRAQLGGYSDKFEAVQSTLTKSNELFASFKSEMDKSAVALKKSEREKAALEKKHNAAQLNVIQMAEQAQQTRAEMDKLQRQNAVLTSLCKELKSKAAASSTAPASADEPEPAAAPDAVAASS